MEIKTVVHRVAGCHNCKHHWQVKKEEAPQVCPKCGALSKRISVYTVNLEL